MLKHPQTGELLFMGGMKFNKPHKSVKDQAKLLEARGLQIKDTTLAEHYLLHLNYSSFVELLARLAGYKYKVILKLDD